MPVRPRPDLKMGKTVFILFVVISAQAEMTATFASQGEAALNVEVFQRRRVHGELWRRSP